MMNHALRTSVLAALLLGGCDAAPTTQSPISAEPTLDTSALGAAGGSCVTTTLGGATSCKDDGTWKTDANAECVGQGLELVKYATWEACSGGNRNVKLLCCPSGWQQPQQPPQPQPQPQSCVGELQGGPTSCKDDTTWKTYASQACAQKGLTLDAFAVFDSCGAGLNRYAKYTCCGAAPPPQPPQPPQSCVDEQQGGPTSCKDDGTWKTYASQACAQKGQVLSAFAVFDSCGAGLNRYAKYTCCSAAPPPSPPPQSCIGESQGDATSCKDDTTWKTYASQACAQKGLTLDAFAVFDSCGAGLNRYAKYTCCK